MILYICSNFKNLNKMKKIVLSVMAVFAFTFSIAQTQDKPNKVQFGIKSGLNIANINFYGNNLPKTKPVPNFHVGAFLEIDLNKKWSFQPELIYSMQGSKFQLIYFEGATIYDTRNTFKLHYLNVPFMFKYSENKVFLEAGPQIGFLTSAKLKTEVEGFGSGEQDAKEIFKDFDFGIGLGLGYNFTDQLTVNFRYNLGLINILEDPMENEKLENSVFALSLAYKFKN